MNWISVKDGLPDTSIEVLVTDGEEVSVGIYEDGAWECKTNGCGCYGEDINVTHWMPMISLPKRDIS